jgi:uncharacterized membrane protein
VSEVYMFDKETGELSHIRRGILSWPSWRWQRGGLIASILAGLLLCLTFPSSASLIGIVLLAVGLYGGIRTGWLEKTDEAPRGARIACVAAVVCGLIIIAIVMMAVSMFGIIMHAMLSTLLGQSFSRRRRT